MGKRILVAILIVAIFICSFNISGSIVNAEGKIPSPFWQLIVEEEEAVNTGQTEKAIEIWYDIIALFDDWDDSNVTKLEIVTPRLQKIALGYEALKDYEKSVEVLEDYIYFASKLEEIGKWNHDAVAWAESKIRGLTFEFELIVKADDVQNNKNYQAKYEPEAGIYFGSTYDRDDRIGTYKWEDIKQYFPKKNAAFLIYLEWGDEISKFNHNFQAAKAANSGVQLAWNTYETIENIKNDESYITRTAEYLEKLDIPVFLRYACEMNVGENGENPQIYKENFRYVADIMRSTAPNVAMVWSPNDVSASDRTMEDYYPGDDYVDWVGVSSYTNKYFGDKTNWGDLQESIDVTYFTGEYANPIAKISEVVKKFGDRKPIMISETGIGHYSKVANEDLTDWAKLQLRRLYIYGPMVYPQLKGIYYFNVDDNITKKASYAFYENNEMHQLYNELVNSDYYLSNIEESATYRYAMVGSSITDKVVSVTGNELELMTYTIVPKVLEPTVSYYINDKKIKETNQLPYTLKLSSSLLKEGDQLLEVHVKDDQGNLLRTKKYTIIKEDGKISVEKGQLSEISFDDVPTSNWAHDYISNIGKRGIITGYQGKFNPNDYITRAEMSTLITKTAELANAVDENSFTDIDPTKWYASFVESAKDYLSGSNGVFRPEENATREEVIDSIIKLNGYSITDLSQEEIDGIISSISDYNEISKKYRDSIVLAVHNNIVSGYDDNTVKPKNNIIRAEVAAILYRTFFQ